MDEPIVPIPKSQLDEAEGLIAAEIRTQMTKNRRQFTRALVLLAIGVAVVALIGWNARTTANTANAAANRSESNQQANYQTCVANNAYRAGSKVLWKANEVLWSTGIAFFVHTGNSAQVNTAIAKMQSLVAATDSKIAATFAPRNCKAIK
jgi:hypothetical protein